MEQNQEMEGQAPLGAPPMDMSLEGASAAVMPTPMTPSELAAAVKGAHPDGSQRFHMARIAAEKVMEGIAELRALGHNVAVALTPAVVDRPPVEMGYLHGEPMETAEGGAEGAEGEEVSGTSEGGA